MYKRNINIYGSINRVAGGKVPHVAPVREKMFDDGVNGCSTGALQIRVPKGRGKQIQYGCTNVVKTKRYQNKPRDLQKHAVRNMVEKGQEKRGAYLSLGSSYAQHLRNIRAACMPRLIQRSIYNR